MQVHFFFFFFYVIMYPCSTDPCSSVMILILIVLTELDAKEVFYWPDRASGSKFSQALTQSINKTHCFLDCNLVL